MRAFFGRVELPAASLDRAARFYREALGFGVEATMFEGEPYAVVREPGPPAGVGGGLVTGRRRPPGPLPVIHVEGADLEDALERILAAGGRLEEPPRAIGRLGRFALFRDTEDNLLGLWSAAEPERTRGPVPADAG